MADVKTEILKKIYEKYSSFWDSDYAVRYTARLFAFCEPEIKIRDALKALSCKKDKDERYRDGRKLLEAGYDPSRTIREFEHMMDKCEPRYRKRTDRSETNDLVMMLLPSLLSQKGSSNVTLDVVEFSKMIYSECENCPKRELCKEAFPILTEYVGKVIMSSNLEVSSDEV